ncbi:hypothetical protein [Serratia sp. (in: enterobacteria)]|uniref:hypothetical protein n=1 Tax=Serratia sp. (in: enterobacteria) TaxID=616 RepID=UPI00398A193C
MVRGNNINEKPHVRSIRFANKYRSQYATYNNGNSMVIPKPGENRSNWNPLGESALQTFVSTEIEEEKFKDLYGREFKKQLYDMFANDYVAQEATLIRSWSGFANQIEGKLVPRIDKDYESEEALNSALDDVMKEQERKKLLEYIEQVIRITGFRYYQQDLTQQASVGGRAAIFLETFEDENNEYKFPKGTPAIIKPLHWSFLDQVRVNTGDWGFQSVRYTDMERSMDPERKFIPASKLVYVTKNDNMVMPNNLFYGMSDYHSILKLSQIVRRCEEVDLPEIVASYWAQPGILKFNNMNTDEIDQFMDSLGPGLLRGFNSKVDYQPVPLKHDGYFIMQLLGQMIEHMLMKLRVPQFLFSFSGKSTSRSEVEIQMNVFRDVVLASDRWWLERHLSDQFYDHLIALHLGEEFVKDPKKLKVRYAHSYMPLSFEDILAKANSLELLSRRAFIDRYEGRKIIGLPPHNKNLDKYYNEIGQLKDLSPVEKIQQKHQEEQAEKRMESFGGGKQTKFQQFGEKQSQGQKGFQPPSQRTNSKVVASVGAGRGNKT